MCLDNKIEQQPHFLRLFLLSMSESFPKKLVSLLVKPAKSVELEPGKRVRTLKKFLKGSTGSDVTL